MWRMLLHYLCSLLYYVNPVITTEYLYFYCCFFYLYTYIEIALMGDKNNGLKKFHLGM